MAKNKDYMPGTDAGLVVFLESFNVHIAQQAATLGLSAAEVAALQADNNAMIAAVEHAKQAKQALKAATAAKRTLRQRFEKSFRKKASAFKTHPAYSEAVGQTLGIAGREAHWVEDAVQPHLKAHPLGSGVVEISFKKGKSNGVRIWCRRGGQDFEFLAQKTRSPFRDERPNLVANVPERRAYYAYYISANDEMIGQQSAIVEVLV